MNTLPIKSLISAAALSITSVVCAADFQQCPLKLAVKQTIQSTVSDWKAFDSNEKYPYVGISFSEGSPDKRTILAPDKEKNMKGGTLATWHFSASTEGYWVSCLYAETSATVARRLPANIQSCEVQYDAHSSPPVVKNWHCSSKMNK